MISSSDEEDREEKNVIDINSSGSLELRSDHNERKISEEQNNLPNQFEDSEISIEEVSNRRYDAKIELDRSFSDESIETNETKSPANLNSKSGTNQGGPEMLENIPDQDSEEDNENMESKIESFTRNKDFTLDLKGASTLEDMSSQSKNSAIAKIDARNLNSTRNTESKKQEHVFKINEPTHEAEGMNFSEDVRQIFGYIERYHPHNIDLPTELKCFVPDYIPAAGEVDDFIKIPPPEKFDFDLELGIKTLDEPKTFQSDPTTLHLQLQSRSKSSIKFNEKVSNIESASNNKHLIEKWINTVNDIHRSKPAAKVCYKTALPDLETLLEVWEPKMEEFLKSNSSGQIRLPNPEIELSLLEYVQFNLSILGIP